MPTLNVNVGILGHVDSGKTSLAKLLSTVASTSAFDKDPQSKKRGITLDLGFSSFTVNSCNYPFSSLITNAYDKVQFTLVDCPGHGSLIRTVLCGCKIIDMVLLVLDVTKGFQTQTAECLVISEITCSQIMVVLNKCDLLEISVREALIDKMKKRVIKTFESTKFKNCSITTITAAPGGAQVDHDSNLNFPNSSEAQNLISLLAKSIIDPSEKRSVLKEKDFIFAVDHCFSISGQGTVMTGTVLSGTISVNQILELPYQKIQKKIKSIQMFRKPVQSIGPGDRAGICVPQLDASLLERGLVGSTQCPNLRPCRACILGQVGKISHFKVALMSKSRLHVFVGQETVLAQIMFVRQISGSNSRIKSEFDVSASYEYVEQLTDDCDSIFLLLEFERPVVCPFNSLVIGAKLDTYSVTSCRLALYGTVVFQMTDANYKEHFLSKIMIFRRKRRVGQVERVVNSRSCIVCGLFKRETNWNIFVGLKATIVWSNSNGESEASIEEGYIESSFGQSGKCRLALKDDLPQELMDRFDAKLGKKGHVNVDNASNGVEVVMEFKRHLFDSQRRMMQ